MKKIIKIVLIILVFLQIELDSQNLIPNYSFERVDSTLPCPTNDSIFLFSINSESVPWFEYNSADYFNSCATNINVSIPNNRLGYQQSKNGDAYIGLYGYFNTVLVREYIEVQLNDSLISGQTYYVQFYVSLGDTSQYAIENLGAMFTDTLFDPFPAPAYTWQTGIPQVENSPGNMLNDKTNWVPISGSFIANGGEQYMTIGNFRNDVQTIVQFLGNNGDPATRIAYYYIDDVYVGSTPPVSIPENEKSQFNYKLYPNPNNGNMIVEYSLAENETGLINLYSVTGTLLYSYPLQQANHKLLIENEELKSGIYLYDVIINDKKVKTEKVVIIK